MTYFLAKTVSKSYDEALGAVTDALKSEGFGVLTEIDVSATLKAKIGVDFPRYKILGACQPQLAHKALSIDNQIGVLMPCNVIVQEHTDGRVEVSAMDPVSAMGLSGKPGLAEVLAEGRDRLERVLAKL